MNNFAELIGRIDNVNYKKKGWFNVYTEEAKKTYKVECSFFCPVAEGDAIYAIVSIEPDGHLKIVRPPFVQIATDKDSILQCFIRVLRGSGFGNTKAFMLFEKFSILSGGDKNVTAFISELARNYVETKDDELLEIYKNILSKELMKKLLIWWHKQRSLRRLYLFGLTNREIDGCKISHEEIYDACLKNPYKLPAISMSKCDEILGRQSKTGDPIDRRCGEIVRKIWFYMDNRGWSGVPSQMIGSQFPDYTYYKERLESEFGVIGDLHTIYLRYAYLVEREVSIYLSNVIKYDYDGEKLYGEPHFSHPSLSEDQKYAIEGALKYPVSVITGYAGTGKCLDPDTPVLMFDGSIKKAKDIMIGDKLMGDNSKERNVLSICSGVDDMYKIIPKKGRPFICNNPHILTLKGIKPCIDYIERKYVVKFSKNGNKQEKVFIEKLEAEDFIINLNEDVFDIPLNEYLQKDEEWKNNTYVFHKSVDFDEKEVLIEPYLFGCWLGGRATRTTNKKGIPDIYKINSRENRLKLLAGLIDTNGYYHDGYIEIKEENDKLAEDIEYLALSLGFMVTNECNTINIFGCLGGRATRTSEACLDKVRTSEACLRFDVEYIGKGNYCGFQIDDNGRFLLGDFLVTHNTNTIKEIIHNLEIREIPYAVVSFTGKAVARIREVIKRKTPSTMHRMIAKANLTPPFKHLIIDEASMVTSKLFYQFIKAFPQPYNITFVGDCNQLQPIEWGTLFEQVIKSNMIPVYKLTKIHRIRGGDSDGIGINSLKIIEYNTIDEDEDDEYREDRPPFEFTQTSNFTIMSGNITNVYDIIKTLHSAGANSSNVTIVTPYNKDIDELNKLFQQIYLDDVEFRIDSRGRIWKLGDRIMMIENNYTINVMNGEEGFVTGLNEDSIAITFQDGASHEFKLNAIENDETINELSPPKELNVALICHAYAVTIHRAQGSEWDFVIVYIPMSQTETSFLSRNMVYTAITRGKKMVWCIGDIASLTNASQKSPSYRCENLSKRIVNCLS
jgi:hypothetical protein